AVQATRADAAPDAAPTGAPVLLLTETAALRSLSASGLDFGSVIAGAPVGSLAELSRDPRFSALREALTADIEEISANDKRAGVGMGSPHRLFDLSWLGSEKTRFELIGVVNRVDRQPFEPAHCGETRLIYRLAYSTTLGGEPLSSRLPMTVNVVYWQDPEGAADGDAGVTRCREVARRWLVPDALSGDALARRLRAPGGPLAPTRVSDATLKSVELNVQSVRWPAVMHPSLAGHAEYVLRVFHPEGEGLTPAPLENTPDVARLKRDATLRAALLEWLRDPANLEAIDAGIAVMPERFAATRSVSVAPRGFARVANRPFSQLFKPDELAALAGLDAREHARTPRGLLRRLDGLACSGCHEARSVAGFHLLGEEPDPASRMDALELFTSPHLDGELPRRARYVQALARGEVVDDRRPLSEFEPHQGAYGTHCGLGDPAFADYRCDEGLRCREVGDPELGACLPPKTTYAGDPCEVGQMRSRPIAHQDRSVGATRERCPGSAVCNPNNIGFPQGMCIDDCDDLQPGERCGAMVSLRPFNNCIGRREPFTTCLGVTARKAAMRACGPSVPCRDDYICARSPNADGGVCLPPYFLFQLRVDGHVL
ncbi:MAG: hypothetical protein KC468_21180, partial [Myxococcales bacterium]|nr:hypothetical protein [Myxococcales bacterium]